MGGSGLDRSRSRPAGGNTDLGRCCAPRHSTAIRSYSCPWVFQDWLPILFLVSHRTVRWHRLCPTATAGWCIPVFRFSVTRMRTIVTEFLGWLAFLSGSAHYRCIRQTLVLKVGRPEPGARSIGAATAIHPCFRDFIHGSAACNPSWPAGALRYTRQVTDTGPQGAGVLLPRGRRVPTVAPCSAACAARRRAAVCTADRHGAHGCARQWPWPGAFALGGGPDPGLRRMSRVRAGRARAGRGAGAVRRAQPSRRRSRRPVAIDDAALPQRLSLAGSATDFPLTPPSARSHTSP